MQRSFLSSFIRPIDVAETLVVLFSSDCRPRKAFAVAQDENYTALSLQSAVLKHMAATQSVIARDEGHTGKFCSHHRTQMRSVES